MAHFTKVDESNIVTETVVIHNDCCLDSENNESEAVGIAFCEGLFGAGTYKQTSYNTLGGVHSLGGTPFRKNYASTGYTWDASKDAFYEPKPFNSWSLDSNCVWQPPITKPDDDKYYYWDEDAYQADNSTGWVEIE
tara:strand:- start:73 stop:480 length:408 start_codon:yes stop_codon:yes gene_type:complete